MRGRKVAVADLPGLRPTPAKVRQALFNIIGNLDGMSMLDLYAGSGIMAIEALSRGAESAISIERNYRAIQMLVRCRDTLALSECWQIIQSDVEQAVNNLAGSHFDLIFADPPYAKGASEQLPALLTRHRISCGQLIIEESAQVTPVWPTDWKCQQSRRYGDTCLHFLNRA